MTINTTTTQVSYTGDGVTTAFAVPFVFFGASELEVISRVIATGAETVLALTTNYTVSGGNGSTGTVTAIVAPAGTVQWVIRRKTARTQLVDYAPNDPFPADTHERALDRLTAIVQEVGGDVDRAVKFPRTDPSGLSTELPNSLTRANKVAGFDATGGLTVYDPAALAATGAIYADYLRSELSGDGTTTTFALPADPLTRDNTWVYISGVYQQKNRYTVTGASITFVVAPPSGTGNVEVIQGQGVTVAAAPPPDGSVGSATLLDGAVTARKESDDPWSSVASAATVDLGAINSRNALITGTTTITSFGNTGTEGRTIRVRFAGALTLTHNATTLILPGAANITTAAGDTAIFTKESGASAWRCVDYLRASGQAIVAAGGITLGTSVSASGTSVDFTGIPAGTRRVTINFSGLTMNALAQMVVQIGDSGGVETTGYTGGAVEVFAGTPTFGAFSGSFALHASTTASGNAITGRIVLEQLDTGATTWIANSVIFNSNSTVHIASGTKALSPGPLDRVRITSAAGTASFNAGTINITSQ